MIKPSADHRICTIELHATVSDWPKTIYFRSRCLALLLSQAITTRVSHSSSKQRDTLKISVFLLVRPCLRALKTRCHLLKRSSQATRPVYALMQTHFLLPSYSPPQRKMRQFHGQQSVARSPSTTQMTPTMTMTSRTARVLGDQRACAA